MFKALAVLALCAVGAQAKCANQCSGHGTCGLNDACTCFPNWQGSDCSLRTCPFGHAWADSAAAHDYAECSNRGTCDRATGECECLDGYEGSSCGRTGCPGDCSGHGVCEYIEELASTNTALSGWDTGKSRGCKCDGGYYGIDCSKRMCPKGDDPLTVEVDITQAQSTSLQLAEVQNVTIQAANGFPINSGNVTFTFTDLYGSTWTTRPVLLPLAKAYPNTHVLQESAASAYSDTTYTAGAASWTANEYRGFWAKYTPVTANQWSTYSTIESNDGTSLTVTDNTDGAAASCDGTSYAQPTYAAGDVVQVLGNFEAVASNTWRSTGAHVSSFDSRAGAVTYSGTFATSGCTTTGGLSTCTISTAITTQGTAGGSIADFAGTAPPLDHFKGLTIKVTGATSGTVEYFTIVGSTASATVALRFLSPVDWDGAAYEFTKPADSYYEHTLNSALNSPIAARKGDWIKIGRTSAAASGSAAVYGQDFGCLVQVAEDITATGTALRTVADASTTPCFAGGSYASSTNSIVHTMWRTFVANNDATNPITYDGQNDGTADKGSITDFNLEANAAYGTITLGGQQAITANTMDISKQLLPGMWIRLFVYNDPSEAYCDMQLNHFPSVIATTSTNQNTLYVDPASATSTYEGGSWLCNSFSFLQQHMHQGRYRGSTANVGFAVLQDFQILPALDNAGTETRWSRVIYPGDTKDTPAATPTRELTLSSGTLTLTNSGANVFPEADAVAALPLGTLVYVVPDKLGSGGPTDHPLYCVGVLTGVAASASDNTLTLGAPPNIAGAAPPSCTTATGFTTSTDYQILLQNGNSIIYRSATDDNNAYLFNHLQAGDSVRVDGIFSGNPGSNLQSVGTTNYFFSSHSATFEVERVDDASTLATTVFFKKGSKPNGGGMYPVLGFTPNGAVKDCVTSGTILDSPFTVFDTPADTTLTYANVDDIFTAPSEKRNSIGRVVLPPTTLIQPVYAHGAALGTTTATTWTTTDTTMLNSAADVKRVLEELPNQVIDTVDVTMTSNTLGLYAYSVTFSGARVSGNQNPITVNSAGCNLDGCQPRFSGVAVQSAFTVDDLLHESGSIKSAEVAAFDGLSGTYTHGKGGETLAFYNKQNTNSIRLPNLFSYHASATDSQATTDSTLATECQQIRGNTPSAVLVLKNVGAYDAVDHSAHFKSETYEITRGTTEASECAGRGSCDISSGVCSCFSGYTGESCSTPTVLA